MTLWNLERDRPTLEGLDFEVRELPVGAVDVRGYDSFLEAAGLGELGSFEELDAKGEDTPFEGLDAE